MIDRLRRIVGRGSMSDDLADRVARTERETDEVNRRVEHVEERMDDLEEILEVRREERRSHGRAT